LGLLFPSSKPINGWGEELSAFSVFLALTDSIAFLLCSEGPMQFHLANPDNPHFSASQLAMLIPLAMQCNVYRSHALNLADLRKLIRI
jgi:hypothetical protein